MKSLKTVFIMLGAVVALGVLLSVIGLIPAVQMWAARKVVADQPGMEISFGKLAAGFSTAKLGDVRVVQEGVAITVKSVDVEYSAWDYLSARKVKVRQLSVSGVEIDLRQVATVGASASPSAHPAPGGPATTSTAGIPVVASPFEGLLKATQLPVELVLAQLSAQGKTLLPEGREVTFDVQGSDLSTGKTGTLKWTTLYQDSGIEAAVESVRHEGAMSIRLAADGKVERIDVDAMTALTGPNLPSDRVRSQITAETSGGGEKYSASLALVQGPSATAKGDTLLSAAAAFDPTTKSINGNWGIAARSEELGALLAGLGLPDLDLNGQGQFSFSPTTSAVALRGEMNAKIARLEMISPELAAVGMVQVDTQFEGAMEGGKVSLTALSLEATDATNQKFAEVRLRQLLGFSLADQRVEVADAKAALASVALKDVPLAWGQPWLTEQQIESGDLSVALTVATDADGKNISVVAEEPFRLKNVAVSQGEQKLVERLELSLNPKINYTAERVTADMADFSISLAAGDAVTGRIQIEVIDPLNKPAITFSTKVDARLVAALKPYLPLDPGPLTIGADLAGRLNGNTLLRLTRTAVRVGRTGDASLVTAINLMQPMQINLDSMTWITDRPLEPTARVKFGTIPLVWVEPFVTDAKLAGSVIGGEFEVGLKAWDDLMVITTEPLTLRGISATVAGQPQVKDLNIAANFSTTIQGETVMYDLRGLTLSETAGSELATFVTVGNLSIGEEFTLEAKGKFDADVAALSKQPALSSLLVAEQGRMAATFDATMRDKVIDAKVNATMQNFVTVPDRVKLADIDLAVTATMDSNGKGKVELPLTIGAGRSRSDLLVRGGFVLPPTPAPGAMTTGVTAPISFEGSISSTRLVVDDLQAYAALRPTSTAPVKPVVAAPQRTIGARLNAAAGAAMKVAAEAPPPARDTEPFWQGLTGQMTLDLKEMHYGPTTVINNIRGAARISSTELVLDGLEALMKQEPLKVNGGITFDGKSPKPYRLSGKVDVKGVAVGPFMQPPNPKQRPQLEATVGVNAEVQGHGGTLPELLKNTYGVFDVNGTAGVLRMLGKRGDTVGKVSSLIGLVGAIRGSESTMAASELASALNDLKFEQFKIRAERGADLRVNFSTIEFISPILRLSGTGNMVAQEGVEIENQPMNIVLTMGGKGSMAQLLGKAGLLSGESDAQGYALLSKTFSVGGTPTNPDASALWRLVTEAGLRAAAGFRSN